MAHEGRSATPTLFQSGSSCLSSGPKLCTLRTGASCSESNSWSSPDANFTCQRAPSVCLTIVHVGVFDLTRPSCPLTFTTSPSRSFEFAIDRWLVADGALPQGDACAEDVGSWRGSGGADGECGTAKELRQASMWLALTGVGGLSGERIIGAPWGIGSAAALSERVVTCVFSGVSPHHASLDFFRGGVSLTGCISTGAEGVLEDAGSARDAVVARESSLSSSIVEGTSMKRKSCTAIDCSLEQLEPKA
jgi:hypothetical protein